MSINVIYITDILQYHEKMQRKNAEKKNQDSLRKSLGKHTNRLIRLYFSRNCEFVCFDIHLILLVPNVLFYYYTRIILFIDN